MYNQDNYVIRYKDWHFEAFIEDSYKEDHAFFKVEAAYSVPASFGEPEHLYGFLHEFKTLDEMNEFLEQFWKEHPNYTKVREVKTQQVPKGDGKYDNVAALKDDTGYFWIAYNDLCYCSEEYEILDALSSDAEKHYFTVDERLPLSRTETLNYFGTKEDVENAEYGD